MALKAGKKKKKENQKESVHWNNNEFSKKLLQIWVFFIYPINDLIHRPVRQGL